MTHPDDPNRPEGGAEQRPHQGGDPDHGHPDYGGDRGTYPGGWQQPPYGSQQPGYGTQPEYGPPADYGGHGGYSGYPGYPDYGGYGSYGGPMGQLPRGLAVAALILGIIGLLGSFVIVGGLLSLLAIILGAVGTRKAGRGEAGGRGMAITGIVLGILGVIVAVLIAVGTAFLFSRFGDVMRECSQQPNREAVQRCVQERLNPGAWAPGLIDGAGQAGGTVHPASRVSVLGQAPGGAVSR